ncbi:hypothetical protein D3C71_2117830 [compost metagenome]
MSITLLGPGVTELTKVNKASGRTKAEVSGRKDMAAGRKGERRKAKRRCTNMLALKISTVPVHFIWPLQELACLHDPDTFTRP